SAGISTGGRAKQITDARLVRGAGVGPAEQEGFQSGQVGVVAGCPAKEDGPAPAHQRARSAAADQDAGPKAANERIGTTTTYQNTWAAAAFQEVVARS